MGFKGMRIWNWAEGYGNPNPKEWRKNFRKKVFLSEQSIKEEFYIKCKHPLDSPPKSLNHIQQAWNCAVEEGHYYGGVIRRKKDVTNEGFSFYSPDGEKQVFVKFDDLVAIVNLEDNKIKK